MRNTTLLGRRDLVDVVRPVHPIASVYIGPPNDVPWPDRLGGLVDRLRDDDADDATIEDLVRAVPDPPDTPLVVFADGGHVPATFAVPGLRGPDTARFAAPARVLPLMAWAQERPPCVVVMARHQQVEVSVAGDGAVAEPVWCRPDAVVDVCRAALGRIGARLVVVRGDDRLTGALRSVFAPGVTVRRVAEPWGARLAEVGRSTARLWTAQSLADFAEQSRTPGHAAQGVDAVLDALVRRRVRELLVVSSLSGGGTAWFGGRSTEVARGTTAPPWSRAGGAAVDVAVRAALVGGVAVRAVHLGAPGAPVGGIGALCRPPLSVVRP